jgi:uncharacterized protein (DUF1697 family)
MPMEFRIEQLGTIAITGMPIRASLQVTKAKGRRGRCEVAAMYVALLRGINVGTAKRVSMADLRALLEGLGYSDVRTLLNSGNVVFSAAKSAPGTAAIRIQKALEAKLGVSARVMVLGAEELAQMMAVNPLDKIADNPSRMLVGIMGDAADREKLAGIAAKDWGKEKIAWGGAARAVYLWLPRGVIESKLDAAVSKALGDHVTARNWSTMLKLEEMTKEREE